MNIESLSHQIIELYDKISSWENSVVKDTGLTPAQMHTIEVIGHKKDLRMKELADKLGITTGTLTIGVDRLVKSGFVERKPHTSDRRSYFVVLTEKGEEMYADHHRFHEEFTREITADLSDEEMNTLHTLLQRVLQKM